MERRKFSWSDTFGGALIALFGGTVIWLSQGYPFGEVTRMGPGFLPTVVGVALVLLGAVIALAGRGEEIAQMQNRRAPLFVFASLLAWAVLLEPFGLIPATIALVVIAAFAHPRPNMLRVLVTIVVLPAACTAIFIHGLGLPIDAFKLP